MKFETLGLMIVTRSCFDEKFGGKLQVNPLVLRIRSDFKRCFRALSTIGIRQDGHHYSGFVRRIQTVIEA